MLLHNRRRIIIFRSLKFAYLTLGHAKYHQIVERGASSRIAQQSSIGLEQTVLVTSSPDFMVQPNDCKFILARHFWLSQRRPYPALKGS